jgi:hypothetical protein
MNDLQLPQVNYEVLPAVIGATKLGLGHEKVEGINEIEIPRAKLIQFTSDEATATNPENRLSPGTLINSITRNPIGILFVPVFKFTTFVQWNPRKKDDPNYDPAFELGEIVFQTTDPLDPKVREGIKFGPNGEAPKVTRYMNFLSYFPGQNMPLVLSFAKTSMQAGQRLNTLAISKGGNMWENQYKLSISQREGATGKYFVLDVIDANVKSDEAQLAVGALWFGMFYNKSLKVHAEEAAPEQEKWAE